MYTDSLTLFKKAFLAPTFSYYDLNTPVNLNTNSSYTSEIDLSTTTTNTLTISNNSMVLNNSNYTSNIGINNNTYTINSSEYINIYSSFYSLSGGSTTTLQRVNNIDTSSPGIYNVLTYGSSTTIWYGPITTIYQNVDNNTTTGFYSNQWTPLYYSGSSPSSNTNVIITTSFYYNNNYTSCANAYGGNDEIIKIDMAGYTPITFSASDTIILYSSYEISYTTTDTYYTGELSMSVNIPSINSVLPEIYYINGSTSVQLTNTFEPSTTATYISNYSFPPDGYFSTINDVSDIESLVTTGYYNYRPTLLPGNTYSLATTTDDYDTYWTSSSSAIMDSDQCRFPWRVSNYIRGGDATEDMLQIAYNAALAMYYTASINNNYISFGIKLYTFENGDGYCGSMVPPLLSLIDSLKIQGRYDDSMNDYSDTIKNMGGTFSQMYDLITTGSTTTYPILDSVNSGDQQFGLAGAGLICTLDFLLTSPYNVMNKYDNITEFGNYDTTKLLTTYNPNPTVIKNTFSEPSSIEDMIKIYTLLGMKGNDFKPHNEWGNDEYTSYASQVNVSAYFVNVRIRDVNISIHDELSFGDNQQSYHQDGYAEYYICGDTGTTSYYTHWGYTGYTGYIPVHFPIYSISDSGWSGPTIEIMTYQLIRCVGMNDYPNFCRFHRFIYYMLFQQNGGKMFNWDSNPDDKITTVSYDTYSVSNKDSSGNSRFWIPSYLKDDVVDGATSSTDNWDNDIIITNNIKISNIYQWPDEYAYSGYTNSTEEPDSSIPTTNLWANRINPYRGQQPAAKVQWTTPSYCMGYLPNWVAAGKTTNTWGESTGATTDNTNRPVAEVLNPYFKSELGLYSATDGDHNLFLAYTLASLQWQDIPPTDISNINIDATENKGYDCDVCDFNEVYGETGPGFGEGVFAAVNATSSFQGGNLGYYTSNIHLTNLIGYGFSPSDDTTKSDSSTWSPIMELNSSGNSTGTRGTTWSYIARSIQRTMISQHGQSGNEGDFMENAYANNTRIITTGHDSSPDSTIHMDYQDPRVYQICKNMNDL